MFGDPEFSYHQTHSARDWLSILRTSYTTQNLQRKRRTDLAFTPAKNATKPNPFKIIPLQPTKKENNWETKEMMERATLTLETDRVKWPNPGCL
jgi:hypothetical protein